MPAPKRPSRRRNVEAGSGSATGLGVDLYGEPAYDPSKNVRELTTAEARRQDDLRSAEVRYNDLRDTHQKEMAELRERHGKELAAKESSRLDSIRQVDREDVAKTAAAANLAIGTLAKQTTDLATTLQAQVQATAASAEARRSADMSEVNKRLSALELAGSASAGKQTVADPQMEALVKQVATLVTLQTTGAGRGAGMSALWGYIVGAIFLVIAVVTFLSRQ